MKKLSETYFKQVQTKPSRTQSPDFKAGNSIRPTRSPQNIEYILKQNERVRTPVKNYDSAANQQHTTASRYFQGNRSQIRAPNAKYNQGVDSFRSHTQAHSTVRSPQQYNSNHYCHECNSGHCYCVHAANNQEVVIQLRKIITMINGATVSSFDTGDQDLRKQVEVLQHENNRLLDLVEKFKAKSEVKFEQTAHHITQSEARILKQQLSQKTNQFEIQRQQLYRTNKTLSSQVKSLEDKLSGNEKELQNLKTQLKVRDQIDSQRDLQLKKKGPQQKLSWSIIKDQYKQQYNSSIKTLKSNMEFQVNNQLNDYESQIRQQKIKLDLLEERLRGIQRVNQINKRLNDENNKLRKQINQIEINNRRSGIVQQPNLQLAKLEKDNQQLNDYLTIIKKQLSETKISYENQLNELKNKNTTIQQKILKETQVRVTKLMENYQQQIKILKKQAKSNGCNHKGIEQENQNLKQQSQQNWQEVIKLRNELVKYTGDNARLEAQIGNYQNQIGKLNHQINNDHLNLIAKTSLLENQNAKLKKQLEGNLQLSRTLSMLTNQNSRLQQKLNYKFNNVSSLAILENQRQMLEADLANIRQQNQNLQQENNKLFYQIDRINSEHSKRELQIRQNLKRQLDETKILYQDQINQSHQQNRQLGEELDSLKLRYSQIQLQVENSRQNEVVNVNQRQNKLLEYQLTISNLSKIIEETQMKIGQLDDALNKKNQENQRLNKNIDGYKLENERNLQECTTYWENQLRIIKADTDNEITRLKKTLADKQSEQQNVYSKLKSKMSVYQTQSLKKQLQELKKLVDEGRFQRIEQQLAKIVQNYQRQLIRSEQKTMEIDFLTKDKCALQQKISDLQRLRLMLQEKTNILQGSIKIVQNQLKQRKLLCESLLNQKVILEKQNLMLKKIKLDKQTIQATKVKAREISLKIDKLLAMEQKRQQNFIQVSHSYSQVLVESRTKRTQI